MIWIIYIYILDCNITANPPMYVDNYVDYMFFSNSDNMTEFCKLYDNLDDYVEICFGKKKFSRFFNHMVPRIHLSRCGLVDKVKMTNKKNIIAVVWLDRYLSRGNKLKYY